MISCGNLERTSSIIVTIIVLVYINFFGITNISSTMLLAALLPFIFLGVQERGLFNNILIWLFVGIALNIVSCHYFRGQDVISSVKALANYFYILSYFLFLKINPSLQSVNKAILWLIIIFDVLYILQFILLQIGIIFLPLDSEIYKDAGTGARFRMVASGLVSLGLFYGCNRFLLQKDKISLILCILSFIVIMLMAFRTMLFFSIVFTVILVIRVQGLNERSIRLFIFATVIFLLLLCVPVISEKLNYMLEKQFGQEAQTLSNSNYIRNVTLFYYIKSHFKSVVEFIFGSGLPFVEHPYYSKMTALNLKGIFFQDWGLIGLSWMIGIIPVICMIWYSIKAARLKVSPRYYYIGIWFVYLVVSSITTSEFYRLGNFVIQALCLYMVQRAHLEYIYFMRHRTVSTNTCSKALS